ncbi:MAG: ABC transporter ATP-binding protein [Treponema sp.]|nr:ABC transporter ATP-binding protein [Treponema sp.]
MLGISKRFPHVLANDNVTLRVRKNEVHALLGENGAGKSTLMSVLFGSYTPNSGEIRINQKKVSLKNPNDATALGIGMVHQHFKLVENYTVAENIVLGAEPKTKFGLLDLKAAKKEVQALSDLYGLKVNPDEKIQDITVGMQQRVEILKVLYRKADIIIFDEPTAVLTPQEIDELMDIIRLLQKEGKTILLITHKLNEIKAVAQRCSILRRGQMIDTVDVSSTSEEKLAELMVGRAVNFQIEKAPPKIGGVVLQVQNLSVKNSRGITAVDNLSMEVRAGEILGIAGVDGNGQSELVAALTGLTKPCGGKIIFNSKDVTNLSIRERIEMGMAHVSEDRKRYGLVAEFTVGENAALKNYYKEPFVKNGIFLDKAAMKKNGEALSKDFDIRGGEGGSPAGAMSGGNQQKLIIARELSMGASLLIFAQPTRGLDVGAIEFIRKKIVSERDSGKAVLLVSFELDEIMNLCDRIATISKGQIVGTYKAGEVDERQIGLMMAGTKKTATEEKA